jgi:hypothetical protein
MQEAHDKVKRAVQLIESETASAIITEDHPEGYDLLIQAVPEAARIDAELFKRNGLRFTPDTQKAMTQRQLIMSHLIHSAYALGIKEGQRRATEGDRPICPECDEAMVRCHRQNEEGDWGVCWLCGCEPDPEIVAKAEAVDHSLEANLTAEEAGECSPD